VPLEWITDPGVFAANRDDWERLRSADPEATFFHTPRFLELYWQEFGEGTPLVAIVTQGGEPIGLCPFEVRDRLLSFLGGFEVTDYMGPVGRPEDRPRIAKELMAGLAARDDWNRADLEGLPEEGSWLGALAEAAETAGLAAEIADDDVAPILDLPADWDAYLAGLKPKQRHEIRRKERRLRERFSEVRLTRSSVETFDADLDLFVEMHRSSEGPKGRFMEEGMEPFFRQLGRELLPEGLFALIFLEGDGEKLAGVVAFRFEEELLLYNSAFDSAHRAMAPGMVLVSEIVKEATGEGCARLDMLKGDLGYKYRFGARPRVIRRLLLERR
jgi:CelD/BcsL family acetyltransferase involved in cellulose biosynthesis